MKYWEHILKITIKYFEDYKKGGIIMTNCGNGNTSTGAIVLVLFILLIIILSAYI